MRVVVSGSTGFIGTALVAALPAAGHEPVRLVRGGSDGVVWDPYQGRIDAAGLEGCDAVVHLSGERIRAGRWTRRHKQALVESRTATTQLLAETLARLEQPPGVMLSASAVGIYGERGDEDLTEASPEGEGFLAELCRAWEAATAPAEEAGIRVAHLRTGLVLARGGGLLPKFLPPGPFVAGRLGSGSQWMSWVTMDDEVGAILHLLGADVSGPVNLTAPDPARNRDFVTALARATRRRRLPPVPGLLLKAIFGGEAAREAALVSQRVRPDRLVASGYEFAHPELEPALAAVLATA